MFRDLFDAVLRVVFGHNAVENTSDWKKAHDKANKSREEIDQIIKEAEGSQTNKP